MILKQDYLKVQAEYDEKILTKWISEMEISIDKQIKTNTSIHILINDIKCNKFYGIGYDFSKLKLDKKERDIFFKAMEIVKEQYKNAGWEFIYQFNEGNYYLGVII